MITTGRTPTALAEFTLTVFRKKEQRKVRERWVGLDKTRTGEERKLGKFKLHDVEVDRGFDGLPDIEPWVETIPEKDKAPEQPDAHSAETNKPSKLDRFHGLVERCIKSQGVKVPDEAGVRGIKTSTVVAAMANTKKHRSKTEAAIKKLAHRLLMELVKAGRLNTKKAGQANWYWMQRDEFYANV